MKLLERRDAAQYMKQPNLVKVYFSDRDQAIQTLEGPVLCKSGDAIVKGIAGEQWPVPRNEFLAKYAPVPPTVAGQNGEYRANTELVLAVQIQEPTEIVLSGNRGRLKGQPGDWLVEYPSGDFGIVQDVIFQLSYRPLENS